MFRNFVILFLVGLLSACSFTSSDDAEVKNQKISTAKINTQLGMAYLQEHQMQQAKKRLLLALDEAPTIPEPWYSMAYFLETTNDPVQANKYYLKAIELAPTRGDSHNNYGTFLCRSGNYRAAIQQFMLATQDPTYLDTATAYENAGLCALKIPDKRQARIYFSNAIKQDPDRKLAQMELAMLDNHSHASKLASN